MKDPLVSATSVSVQLSASQPPMAPGPRGLGTLLRIAQGALAVVTLAGTPAVVWFHLYPPAAPLPWIVMATALFGALLLAVLVIGPALGLWRGLADRLAQLPSDLMLPLVVGLALRWGVLLLLVPTAASDGSSYLGLARQLVRDGTYGQLGAFAFWPPGYPFLLAPGVALGLPQGLWLGIFNAGFYALALFGARSLLVQLRVPALHGMVFWLLALWPTHVLCSSLPEKELVVLALLPWACCFALRVPEQGWPAALMAGLLAGVMILVQPSLQFLPIALLLGMAFWARQRGRLVSAALVGIVAVVMVVLPWTLRNLSVLGQPVLVSTNGGDVLYRANNDLATGVYTKRASIDLEHLDELAKDRASKRLAVEWIVSNPQRFLQLGASKLFHFLGDDSYGGYAVFSRGGVELDRVAYLLVRQVTGLPWPVVWFFLLAWLWHARPGTAGPTAGQTAVVALPIAYLTLIHTIFESGPKYHLPLLVPLLVLLAIAGSRARAER